MVDFVSTREPVLSVAPEHTLAQALYDINWPLVGEVALDRVTIIVDGMHSYVTKEREITERMAVDDAKALGFRNKFILDLAKLWGNFAHFTGKPIVDTGKAIGVGIAKIKVNNSGEDNFLEGVAELSGGIGSALLLGFGLFSINSVVSKSIIFSIPVDNGPSMALAGISYDSLAVAVDATAVAGMVNFSNAIMLSSNNGDGNSATASSSNSVEERERIIRSKPASRNAKIVTKLEDLTPENPNVRYRQFIDVELPDGSLELRIATPDDFQASMVLKGEKVCGAGTFIFDGERMIVLDGGGSTSFPTYLESAVSTERALSTAQTSGLNRIKQHIKTILGDDMEVVTKPSQLRVDLDKI